VPPIDADAIKTRTSGEVFDDARNYAAEKVANATRVCHDPVLFAEVTLTMEPDPARERPAIVETTLDVGGRPSRTQVAARDLFEAIDLLEDRLTRRLRRDSERNHREGAERHRTGRPVDGEWRHGDLPTQRPEHLPRPADERDLVRSASYAPAPMTIDDAAADLDALGQDFYVFTLLETGTDAIVHYREDGRLGLHLPEGTDLVDPTDGVVVSAVPILSTREAIERLDAGGERFVPFVELDTARGAVLYHRYDGHLGLVTAR
jgi:ribosomal subunit interface protein